MRAVGNLRVPTGHSRDILLQATRGSPGSSPLRSDGSRDDQAGEAGPVEHSSAEAKSLKLKAKGLSSCHPSGQQPRQPDGGPEGQIKNYSHDNLLKENRAQSTARTGSND
jgi:hypothetical protein